MRFFPLGCIFFLCGEFAYSAETDSVQVRMFHGLDEMGAGASFFLQERAGASWIQLQGNSHALYRRPASSQGDLKRDGEFLGVFGQSLHPKFDLRAVFQGDFYQFQPYSGPAPAAETVQSPPDSWDLIGLSLPSTSAPQRISSPYAGLGGVFKLDTLLELSADGGRRWDYREGYDDHGFSGSLGAQLQGATVGGYRNDLDLYAQQERLGSRFNRELRLQYGLNKEFSEHSADRLNVYYRQKRHDYHIWGTSAIGMRLDTDQSLHNQLRYDLDPQVGFLLESQLGGSRHEDQSAGASALREETNTSTALRFNAGRENVSGWLRLKLDWGGQEDATGLKRERGTSLEEGLSWKAGARDSLNLTAAVRKRQYDTSDTSNYDDRDRLRYEIDLGYGHVFNRYFHVWTRSQVTLEHLVYIYGERSDQNNWNRIFKLGPEVYFEAADGWINLAQFELAANFADYDFELDPAAIKSTVYRRYSALDSLKGCLSRGWDLHLEYSLDLEDAGRLLWDEWIQQLSEEYRTHKALIRVERQTPSGVRFAVGFSGYERKGWQHYLAPEIGTVKTPFLYLTRWGPILQMSYPSSARIFIEAVGDLSWVHQWGSEDYSIVNLDIRIAWR